MFIEKVGESVASAIFWLLIIGGIGITLRFLVRDIMNFVLEDVGSKNKEESD